MRKLTTEVLRKLRTLMKDPLQTGGEVLSAYIVPSCDAHNSEYICPRDERRAFISGFTGSAGTALVTAKDALLWTDGRYYLQAEAEMDENWKLMREGLPETPSRTEWLQKHLETGCVVGIDPYLCPNSQWNELRSGLEKFGLRLVGVEQNLVDHVWGPDQPERPEDAIVPLELEFSGRSWEDKVADVRMAMAKKKADILLLSALDEVAWLLNLRGSDIKFNPVFFSFCAVTANRVLLFVNESQVNESVRKHLTPTDVANMVEIRTYDAVRGYLADCASQGAKIWLSNSASRGLVALSTSKAVRLPDLNGPMTDEKKRSGTVSPAVTPQIESPSSLQPICEVTPVALAKAIKNPTELDGFAACHIRDGAALCAFFAWLEKEVTKGTVTELSAAAKLLEYRTMMNRFVGPSFETISAVGPNAAIIHYRSSPETDRTLTTDEIYLVDSGGQYKDGTTDVTRTVHFGTPKAFEKEAFTRVLKGQISLAKAVFPNKTCGHRLDSFARKFLWDVGLDYGHGTGHGVGAYLNVHEGPMGISWRMYPDDPGLQEGMILSNEPGYYQDGSFGIRLENLVRVVPCETPNNFQARGYLTFETITMCPIQMKLIDPSLLTAEEQDYLNNYHEECRDKVGPLLRETSLTDGLSWLIKETEPLG